MKRILVLLLALLLFSVLFLSLVHVYYDCDSEPPESFFFGVSYGLQTVEEAKLQIDKVKDYTNFFVINNWDITINESALNEVCDYAASSGLSFIVFFDFISFSEQGYPWHTEWVLTAKDRWGDKFLGIYIYEEPGGKQIDTGLFDEFNMAGERARIYENVTTYSEAAQIYVNELPKGLSFNFLQTNNIPRFVSDYALYWFDYMAGYDVVFAELGFGLSTPQQIGLCRGAATAQNKEWGTIIVWKARNPEDETMGIYKTGPEMLQDMLTSYEAGANYVVIFNFPQHPEDNPYGILTEEHFSAMQQFWQHVCDHPEDYGKTAEQVAFVLPKDYGWGMRTVDDKIWGLWPADTLSPVIWENMNRLIEKYGTQLDIVYDDPMFSYDNYREVFFYSSTIK
jgi:hypothetical protein